MGKLLGPRGNSLKRLQEETLTKMSILGKGSMRDKTKVSAYYVSGVFECCNLPKVTGSETVEKIFEQIKR